MMNSSLQKWGLLAIKALLTLAFLGAGFAKLSGQEMMIATYDAIGVGQWFRYLTGAIEVGGAALLWVRGYQGWAAAVLGGTMVGAVLAHLFVLGPSAVPAIVLGLLLSVVLWTHRDQVPVFRSF